MTDKGEAKNQNWSNLFKERIEQVPPAVMAEYSGYIRGILSEKDNPLSARNILAPPVKRTRQEITDYVLLTVKVQGMLEGVRSFKAHKFPVIPKSPLYLCEGGWHRGHRGWNCDLEDKLSLIELSFYRKHLYQVALLRYIRNLPQDPHTIHLAKKIGRELQHHANPWD